MQVLQKFAVGTIVVCLLMTLVGEASVADNAKGVILPAEKKGIRIWVDKGCYEDGEYLTIHFQAEQSGYLTIYDFTPDGQSSRIFPNAYTTNRRIDSGIEYTLPTATDPFHFEVDVPTNVPPGATEILWAVITEEEISFPDSKGMSPGELIRKVQNSLDDLGCSSCWAADTCEFAYGPCESPAPVDQPKAEDFALVIGINDYVDRWVPSPDDPTIKVKFPKLRGCVPDARAIANLLEGEYDNVKLILDHEATYESIQEGFTDWLSAATPGSRVLIYYSGHGATQADKDGDEDDGLDETLVPYNWADERRFITDDDIGEWIKALQAKKVLLIIDSCHSGTIADITKGITDLRIRTYQVSYLDRGYLPLSSEKTLKSDLATDTRSSSADDKTVISLEACEAAESALESKLEGEYHGLFTYFVLQALEGKGDWEGTSQILARELFEFSRKEVIERTTNWHNDDPRVPIQHPTLESTTLDDIIALTRQ